MTESDIKTTKLTASGQVSATGTAARVVGYHIVCGASAGSLILNDGGSGGTSRMEITTPGGVTIALDAQISLGKGIRFSSDCYATISNLTAVTVFWY